MPGTATPRFGFVKPLGPDPVQQLRLSVGGNQDMVEALGLQYAQGTTTSRPVSTPGTPGITGRVYYHTTGASAGNFDYDYGTGWVTVNPSFAVDGAVNVGTLRTLGTGPLQAAAGTDLRLSNERTPIDNSVTTLKVNSGLKPSEGAASTTESLRAIGNTPGKVAGGDQHTFAGPVAGITTLAASALASLTGGVVAPAIINAQAGTSYALVLADQSKLVTLANASPITLMIPANTSVAYAIGTQIDFVQRGTGQVTFTPGGGVTVESYQSKLKIAGQYASATLVKQATDTWTLVGSLG